MNKLSLKRVPSDSELAVVLHKTGASPGFGRGGARTFFQIWEFACCEARGVRGHAPPRKFLKRCNLVRFGVYFDQILYLFFFSKITIFYIKKNYY